MGMVDYGVDGSQTDEEATHALCFVAVALNGSWKLPIAHFFTSTINGQELANLVTIGLDYLNEIGCIVTNLTSDNASSNITMLRLLGAKITEQPVSNSIQQPQNENFETR